MAFLLISFLVTSGSATLAPPFQVPDEPQHFERAYQLSEGGLLAFIREGSAGGLIPGSLPPLIACFPERSPTYGPAVPVRSKVCSKRAEASGKDETRFASFEGSAFYSPLPYLPQAAAIALSRAIGFNLLDQFRSARYANALSAACVSALSLLIAPELALMLATVALLPMTVFETGSCSPDALVISASLLLFASTFKAAVTGRWARLEYIAAVVSAVIIISIKPVYAPLTLISLVPGIFLTSDRARFALLSLSVCAVAIIASISWLTVNSSTVVVHKAGVSPKDQMHFLIDSPTVLVSLLFRTIRENGVSYVESTLGQFGWLTIRMPKVGYVVAFASLVSARMAIRAPFCDRPALTAFWRAALCLGCFLFLEIALYLMWSPVGAPVISGVQGRYFIPILPALLLTLPGALTVRAQRRAAAGITFMALPVALALAAHTIYSDYRIAAHG